jgi:hypothetical protein
MMGNFLIIFFEIIFFSIANFSAASETTEFVDSNQYGSNSSLSYQLIEMARLDQEVRLGWRIDEEWSVEHMQEVDDQHLIRLREIVKDDGWPGFKLVGEEGARAMWLLVQHTPDLEFQKECLILLEAAVVKQDASPIHLAYLKDRVLMYEGKKQIYGTQFQIINQKLVVYPIEDEVHVDDRRLAIGLCSFAEYKRMMIENNQFLESDE